MCICKFSYGNQRVRYSTMDGFMRGLMTRIASDEMDETQRNRTNSSRSMTLAINFHSSLILLLISSSSSSSLSWSSLAACRCFDTTILRWPRTAGSSGPPGAAVFVSLSDTSSLVVAALCTTRPDRFPGCTVYTFTILIDYALKSSTQPVAAGDR